MAGRYQQQLKEIRGGMVKKAITVFIFLLASHNCYAEVSLDLLKYWVGIYKLKSCDVCSAEYQLAPDYALNNLTQVELNINTRSTFPVCVERVFVSTQQKTKMGNCFKIDQISADHQKIVLKKSTPDEFELVIEFTRKNTSNEVEVSIQRVTNSKYKLTPFFETPNLNIELSTIREITED